MVLPNRLLAKLKGVLGYDTTATRVYERPLYEYTLEREVTIVTAEGHGHGWIDGEFVVWEANDSEWARWTIYEDAMKPLGGGHEEVRRVSGVMDWNREPIGTTVGN